MSNVTPISPTEPNAKGQEVGSFIKSVLPSDSVENAVFWHVADKPKSCPLSYAAFMRSSATAGRGDWSGYIGTATMHPDSEGRLFNRQAQFKALWCVVLDDVGEKVKLEDMPKELRENPSWIIETKPGSFQYGYILAEPITDKAQARALVKAVYTSGYTDSGGGLVNKAIRLPCGSRRAHSGFTVRLVDWDEGAEIEEWTPEELLKEIGIRTPLAELAESEARSGALRRLADAGGGNVDGVVDELLEWLAREERILDDSGEWVTIKCPWADEHTSGGDFAYYSPLGRGGDEWRHVRGFNCFHSHEHNTNDFLKYVAEASRGEVVEPAQTRSGDKIAEFALNVVGQEGVVSMVDGCELNLRGFQTDCRKVLMPDGTGVSEYAIWQASERRVTVYGREFRPDISEKLFKDWNGRLLFNQYIAARWRCVEPNMEHVNRFLDFVKYLVPIDDEREYLLNWMASKVKNPAFRGNAIFMVSRGQGRGRDTFGKMMAELVGLNNAQNVDFKMVSSGFTDWAQTPLVIISEVRDGAKGGAGRYTAYETMKEYIDPAPKSATLNKKYGGQFKAKLHSSFLMFTNHRDALANLETDRRLYVITNPREVLSDDKFTELHKWREQGDWIAHVGSWLLARDVSEFKGCAPAPMTEGKLLMIAEAESDVDEAVREAIEAVGGDYFFYDQVENAVKEELEVWNDARKEAHIRKAVKTAICDVCEDKGHRLNVQNKNSTGRRGKVTAKVRRGVVYNSKAAGLAYKNHSDKNS